MTEWRSFVLAAWGRQKIAILLKGVVLSLCGAWGKRQLRESILGRTAGDAPPAPRKFGEFIALIHKSTRPRRDKLRVFDDATLKRLTMPVLAIVGGKDVPLDSSETRRRMEALFQKGEARYLEDAGHFIPGQGPVVEEFLSRPFRTA